ncbi:DUF1835 domain-containing protein [Aromatoleum aromaticum]|uniref:DUF1835 domain-containing protein n=1 Tax=Aromatoleum aromaticum TaxID=551760 RepID=UPI0002FE774C|nr:DUF1835 domain-containing protein [Aromatoleum aromaticum]
MTDEATHLVLGDAAAGVLRDAMTAGMPAAAPILRFRDIYCIGPLGALGTADGPASRARYWAQLLPDAPPGVTEFDEEETRYAHAADAARHGTVFIWTGAHSSSQLWLQRLCATFSPQAADVRLVEAVDPGAASGGRRAVTQFDPGDLGELLARMRALDGGEIARLAGEWQRNRSVPSGVRRWTDGRITHHGDDFYDALLLTQCDDDWQAADQVIGAAQWECDEFLGDVFFAWRLRCLATSGRLLWRSPDGSLAEAVVRLPGSGGSQGTLH